MKHGSFTWEHRTDTRLPHVPPGQGGFLSVLLSTKDRQSTILFELRDVDGKVVCD